MVRGSIPSSLIRLGRHIYADDTNDGLERAQI